MLHILAVIYLFPMQLQQRYYIVYTYHAQTLRVIRQAMQKHQQYRYLRRCPLQINPAQILIFAEVEGLPRTTLDFLEKHAGVNLVVLKNITSLEVELYHLRSTNASAFPLSIGQAVQFHELSLARYKDQLYINNTNEEFFIPLSRLLFLRADNNYAQLFLADNTYIQAFESLKSFQQRLPDYFLRTHKSYLVNTRYIYRIRHHKREIQFRGQTQVARFSQSKKPQLLQILQMLKSLSY